jgi:hypothetical protein
MPSDPDDPNLPTSWESLLWHRVGSRAAISDPDEGKGIVAGMLFSQRDLVTAKQAGAVGAVIAVDACAERAAGQYTPILTPYRDLPALYVDRDTGAALRDAVAAGPPTARLQLVAIREERATDQLTVVLPGRTDELVVVNTHTDGPNLVEENGGAALLALARYFAASTVPRARGLLLLFATAHCTAGPGSADFFVAQHPDLVERASAAFCVEHLGAREWREEDGTFRATGRFEPACCYVTDHAELVALVVEAAERQALDNVWIMRPILEGMIPAGEAAPFSTRGIPTACYIPVPEYLLSWAADGHRDKVDAQRMHDEIATIARVVSRLVAAG